MRFTVRHSRLSTVAGAIVGALVVSLTLAACGSTSSPTTTDSSAGVSKENNAADVRFVQGMIPHHQQAVEMADLAIARAQNPEVKKLAEQIKSEQDPEINLMRGFLQAWGAPAPAEPMAGMDHSGSGGQQGTGMMTSAEMDQLRNATGAQFDRMFLEMMTKHHQGAIADAKRELAEGVNPQAKQLATQIVATQSAEVTRMQQLLATV